METTIPTPRTDAVFLALLLTLALAALVGCCVRMVQPGQRLVVRRQGDVVRDRGPGLAWVWPVLETTEQVSTQARTLWSSVRASSADGALVRLDGEATVEVLDPALAADDAAVVQEIDERLRLTITRHPLLAVPSAGDEVVLHGRADPPGVLLGPVVVIAADVEVTRELRRLVGGP